MKSSGATGASAIPITGNTAVFLIVGDPVEQVKAPETFNLVFKTLGIDAVLAPAHVVPADLPAFVRTVLKAGNIRGLWVAIPHKAPMLDVLDSATDIARLAGAVNAVRREDDGTPGGKLAGALFDGEGFMGALRHHGIASADKKVLVLGAGGGAAAIAASLAVQGTCASIALYDPLPGKAAGVAGRIGAGSRVPVRAVDAADPAGYDLVVNASPLGLGANDAMPCDVSRMQTHAAAFDIVMKNQPTPWVRAARARGLVAHPGFEMLIQQTAPYLEFFGFHDAARAVREDADFLRTQIYPRELLPPSKPVPVA